MNPQIGDKYILHICIIEITDKHYEVEIINQYEDSSYNRTVTYIRKSELENIIQQ